MSGKEEKKQMLTSARFISPQPAVPEKISKRSNAGPMDLPDKWHIPKQKHDRKCLFHEKIRAQGQREIMLFIGKPKGRSRMISNTCTGAIMYLFEIFSLNFRSHLSELGKSPCNVDNIQVILPVKLIAEAL